MNHYWTAEDLPAMRQAQAEDWVEDLVEFPVESIEWACREWRRTKHNRPMPSDIRKMLVADQVAAQERAKLRALPAPARPQGAKQRQTWEPGYAARYDEPWFRRLPPETQLHFKEQDLDRAAAHRRCVEARTTEEGRAAEQAFVSLCTAQSAGNLKSIKILKPVPADEPAPWYEDQDALRRAREDLGLEVARPVESNVDDDPEPDDEWSFDDDT